MNRLNNKYRGGGVFHFLLYGRDKNIVTNLEEEENEIQDDKNEIQDQKNEIQDEDISEKLKVQERDISEALKARKRFLIKFAYTVAYGIFIALGTSITAYIAIKASMIIFI